MGAAGLQLTESPHRHQLSRDRFCETMARKLGMTNSSVLYRLTVRQD
jgi:hypothetical protein